MAHTYYDYTYPAAKMSTEAKLAGAPLVSISDAQAMVVWDPEACKRTWREAARAGDFKTCSSAEADINGCLIGACEGGHTELAKKMIGRGASNLMDGVFTAHQSGFADLATDILSIETYAQKIRVREFRPSRVHHDETSVRIKKSLFRSSINESNTTTPYIYDRYNSRSRGSSPLNYELHKACLSGDLEEVKSMLALGADDLEWGLEGACVRGHEDVAELMILLGAHNWNRAMRGACMGNHLDLIKKMVFRGAVDYNGGMKDACTFGNLAAAKLMISYGADDWDSGLDHGCPCGHTEVVELMISHGARRCPNTTKHCHAPLS